MVYNNTANLLLLLLTTISTATAVLHESKPILLSSDSVLIFVQAKSNSKNVAAAAQQRMMKLAKLEGKECCLSTHIIMDPSLSSEWRNRCKRQNSRQHVESQQQQVEEAVVARVG